MTKPKPVMPDMQAPRTITNSNSREVYRPSWAPVRPGAQDHEVLPSRFNDTLTFRNGKTEVLT